MLCLWDLEDLEPPPDPPKGACQVSGAAHIKFDTDMDGIVSLVPAYAIQGAGTESTIHSMPYAGM